MRKSLKNLWLLVSVVLVVLPVFLPSSMSPHNVFSNVMEVCSMAMFVLSFPMSLFGLPAMATLKVLLGIDPNSIGGLYFQLIIFFICGFTQWFCLAPKFLGKSSVRRSFSIQAISEDPQLEQSRIDDFMLRICTLRKTTPLERVFRQR